VLCRGTGFSTQVQARPDQVLPIARRALCDGAFGYLIADPRSHGSAAANIREMGPKAMLYYGMSTQVRVA
jgi:hypothetical protein